jgi:hypothetical protein
MHGQQVMVRKPAGKRRNLVDPLHASASVTNQWRALVMAVKDFQSQYM